MGNDREEIQDPQFVPPLLGRLFVTDPDFHPDVLFGVPEFLVDLAGLRAVDEEHAHGKPCGPGRHPEEVEFPAGGEAVGPAKRAPPAQGPRGRFGEPEVTGGERFSRGRDVGPVPGGPMAGQPASGLAVRRPEDDRFSINQ